MQRSPTADSIIAGKFRVVRSIGRGGMGVVLEAENVVTGKRVAVKCLHPFMADESDLAARLVREARASARVRHPNVVDVYDVVQEEEQVYLVMELLEGEPLSAVLRRGGMPLHELVALLLAAMRGVAAAHAKGVIHRDIKPDNIFLAHVPGETALVKVLDFGISKLDGTQRGSLSSSGVVGTPLYMSYEQLCNAADIDARSDVYAFGVILYEAMTGQCPFQADSFPQLAVKIMEAAPLAPRQLQPELPSSLERVILKAMARDRDQRTPNIAALMAELTPFSTAEAFKLEMTSDHRSLPRVIARGSGPALAPTVGAKTVPASATQPPRAVPPIDAAASGKRSTRSFVLAVVVFLTSAVFLAIWRLNQAPQAIVREAAPATPSAAPAPDPSPAQPAKPSKPESTREPESAAGQAESTAVSAPANQNESPRPGVAVTTTPVSPPAKPRRKPLEKSASPDRGPPTAPPPPRDGETATSKPPSVPLRAGRPPERGEF